MVSQVVEISFIISNTDDRSFVSYLFLGCLTFSKLNLLQYETVDPSLH